MDALGARIDRDLTDADVRCNGGEPTFVSIDDMDGYEWNYGALGDHKRQLAGGLFKKLAQRFAKSPLLHYGQGKWYPGEQLPRWALGCYWRKDGDPIWVDEKRCANDGVDYGVSSEDAGRFLQALARRLDVDGRHAQAGYEDAFYYMLRERRLPVNVDVVRQSRQDEMERRASRRLRSRPRCGGGPYPTIRPIGGGRGNPGPGSCGGSTVLDAGRFADGLPASGRFPAVVATLDHPYVIPNDPFVAQRRCRGGRRRLRQHTRATARASVPAPGEPPKRSESDAQTCARARRRGACGHPHVFCRGRAAEDYLDLVASVEETATELDWPFASRATRRRTIAVAEILRTPSPGVIEVNIHLPTTSKSSKRSPRRSTRKRGSPDSAPRNS